VPPECSETSVSHFKMHQNRFRLGLCPRPRWGSSHRSPQIPYLKWGKGMGGRGRGGGERKERRRGRGEEEGEGGEKGKSDPQILKHRYAYMNVRVHVRASGVNLV
jgi:hypothetical protein